VRSTSDGGKVIVVGAGVGGLATSIALRRAGIDVAVFERSADVKQLHSGLGIFLWQNAVRVLRTLGVAAIEGIGGSVERMEWRDAGGKFIAAWPVGELSRKLGVPALGTVRADLHEQLVTQVEDGVLHLDSELVGFDADETSVTARFADGREERADALVGADGIRSLVRATLHGGEEPKYPGYMIRNAVVGLPEGTVPPDVFLELWGPATRFGLFPVGGRTYWYCIAAAPRGSSDSPAGRKADLLSRCRGWADPTEAVIGATPEASIGRADILARDPLKQWGRGRVTLLGDAAHAMTPNLGQGAAQAMEDAVVLTACLREYDDVASALRAYETRRAKRTASIMKLAWTIGATGRWESRAACAARTALMKLAVPTIGWSQQRRDVAYEV
jgi:2-polyprenyl-6-methoxyphenol hydroxylase-like FAD-dependent oxidoreductase